MTEKKRLEIALIESIRKWREIRKSIYNTDENPCPLCNLYCKPENKARPCLGCPLEVIKDRCCKEWDDADNAIREMITRLKKELRKIRRKKNGKRKTN